MRLGRTPDQLEEQFSNVVFPQLLPEIFIQQRSCESTFQKRTQTRSRALLERVHGSDQGV